MTINYGVHPETGVEYGAGTKNLKFVTILALILGDEFMESPAVDEFFSTINLALNYMQLDIYLPKMNIKVRGKFFAFGQEWELAPPEVMKEKMKLDAIREVQITRGSFCFKTYEGNIFFVKFSILY